MTGPLLLTIFGVGDIFRRKGYKVLSCCASAANHTLGVAIQQHTLTLHWADATVLNQFFVDE
jgi:hypothetical protein